MLEGGRDADEGDRVWGRLVCRRNGLGTVGFVLYTGAGGVGGVGGRGGLLDVVCGRFVRAPLASGVLV